MRLSHTAAVKSFCREMRRRVTDTARENNGSTSNHKNI